MLSFEIKVCNNRQVVAEGVERTEGAAAHAIIGPRIHCIIKMIAVIAHHDIGIRRIGHLRIAFCDGFRAKDHIKTIV